MREKNHSQMLAPAWEPKWFYVLIATRCHTLLCFDSVNTSILRVNRLGVAVLKISNPNVARFNQAMWWATFPRRLGLRFQSDANSALCMPDEMVYFRNAWPKPNQIVTKLLSSFSRTVNCTIWCSMRGHNIWVPTRHLVVRFSRGTSMRVCVYGYDGRMPLRATNIFSHWFAGIRTYK